MKVLRFLRPQWLSIFATSNQIIQPAQNIFFTRLPPEIRNLIYEFLARHVRISVGPPRATFHNASFLITCRQAADEFLPVLYGHHGDKLIQIAANYGDNPSRTPVLFDFISWTGSSLVVQGLSLHQNDLRALSDMLWAACMINQTEIALAVVARMVTLKAKKLLFIEGLCHSVRHGNYQMVKALLSAGAALDDEPTRTFHAKVDLVSDYRGARWGSPISIACRFGHHDIVVMLIEHGADMNASGKSSNALTAACYYGRSSIAQLLLDRGADIDRISGEVDQRISALGAAAQAGRDGIFDMLLARGAAIIYSEDSTDTLYRACQGGSTHILDTLLSRGANLHSRNDPRTKSYLEIAASCNNVLAVDWLLRNGMDVNLAGWDGPGSALSSACLEGHLEMASMLLEAGADVNASLDQCYASPLQTAAKRGHMAIVALLIERGAEVDAVGYYGTALTCAACTSRVDIVHYLLQKGANVSKPGGLWKSPLYASWVLARSATTSIILLRAGAEVEVSHQQCSIDVKDPALCSELKGYNLTVADIQRRRISICDEEHV